MNRTLGNWAFRGGSERHYVAMRDEEIDDKWTGIEWGVGQVRVVFVAGAAPE